MTVSVLLADGDPLLRPALGALLRTAPGLEVVAEVADGPAAVEAAVRLGPAVALLDLRLPLLDGLSTLDEIGRRAPAVRVAVLTTLGDEHDIARALAGGAAGFLLKDAATEELPYAVRALAAGDAYLSPRVTRHLLDHLPPPSARPARPPVRAGLLSPRERDILVLMAQGLSDAAIGRRLWLPEAAVRGRLARILAALGCTNRAEAALLAQRAGLVT